MRPAELESETLAPPAGLTEDALALEFTRRHQDELLYVHELRQWYRWTGHRWAADRTISIHNDARKLVRELGDGIEQKKLAARIESAATVNAIVSLARSDRTHARVPEDLDPDPMVLNTPAGTIDIRTGSTHAHRRADMITKITPVSPSDVTAPHWAACLATWTCSDNELIAFLQRLCGYWLTGSVREEKFVVIHGPAGAGKTKFVEAVRGALGNDYVTTLMMETLMATNGSQHPTDRADLRGKRLAIATETEQGRRLAESMIKYLTGGDTIKARHMRQDGFEFTPTHKICIVGNHRPEIRNVDDAMRRRVILIPFVAVIPPDQRDLQLAEKLEAERPAILAWMIEGARLWLERGLDPPKRVLAATEEYLASADAVTRWIEERCVRGPIESVTKAKAFESWRTWAEAAGEFPGKRKWLIERICTSPGINEGKIGKNSDQRGLIGIGLLPETDQ
jgi:putative DNA primase/helicase